MILKQKCIHWNLHKNVTGLLSKIVEADFERTEI